MLLVGLVVLAGGLVGTLLGRSQGDDARRIAATTTVAVAAKHGDASTRALGTSSAGAEAAAGSTPDGSATDPRHPAAWPLHGASAHARTVPILMYHVIAAAPEGTAYPELWVPPAELEAQVKALAAAGFTGVTLREVWDAWHGHGRLPRHPVVLSFDDGDISQVLGGAPALEHAGWPGVLNLATNHLRQDGLPMWGARRLLAHGWEIDSHTISHADVTGLGADALRHELEGSRAQIKARLGRTPMFFCYPAGRNDAASRAAAKAAGYLAATTTQPGLASVADDPYALPRLRVTPGMSGGTVVKLARGTLAGTAGGAGG